MKNISKIFSSLSSVLLMTSLNVGLHSQGRFFDSDNLMQNATDRDKEICRTLVGACKREDYFVRICSYASIITRIWLKAPEDICRLAESFIISPRGIHFSVNLPEAGMTEADLSLVNLNWAELEHANLEKANLEMADLIGANLAGTNLAKATLNWADLRGANLAGANLERADLRGACLEGSTLTGANLVRARAFSWQKEELEQAGVSQEQLKLMSFFV